MTCTKKKIESFLLIAVMFVAGFILGRVNFAPDELETVVVKPIVPEKVTVELIELNGDELKVSLNGDVRVVWSGGKLLGGGWGNFSLSGSWC